MANFIAGPELYLNNSQIDIRQKNNTNFVEKYKFNENNELVWANPQLNLSGPVGYTKVGNPTITDNVASGFSSGNYLKTASVISSLENMIYVVKAKTTKKTTQRPIGYSTNNNASCGPYFYTDGTINLIVGGLPGNLVTITTNYQYELDTWYWIKVVHTSNSISLYISTDGLSYTLIGEKNNVDFATLNFTNRYISLGGAILNDNTIYSPLSGSIDLKETYIKVNDKLWFYGKNYTSENYAPVPAGLNYNNTTTPSIGYVNTQTQEFIPAPTDGIKYSQTRDIKVVPPEDNTITLLYGTQENHHLPSEYEELEAIQSSGTQYIDTGIIANGATTTFDFKFKTANQYGAVFGSRVAYGNSAFAFTNVSSWTRWDYDSVTTNFLYLNGTYICKSKITEDSYILEAYNTDGTLVNTITKNKSSFSANCNILLFARNDNGTATTNANNITTLYYFKLYDNGTLVRNLIPARRKSDSAVGMYDTVYGVFYTNQGTGTFTASAFKYGLFGLLANTSSGTYDVYIDDVLYTTTASGTQTDIDFSALGAEYVSIGTCTTPESLVLHKIVIKPNTNGATITQFQCKRNSTQTGIVQQGVLWGHFELDNILSLCQFALYNNSQNRLLTSVTAKNNILNMSNGSNFLGQNTDLSGTYKTFNIKYIPNIVLTATSGNVTGGMFNNRGSLKRVNLMLTNNLESGDLSDMFSGYNIEQINIKGNLSVSSCSINQKLMSSCYKLKMIPKINMNNVKYSTPFITYAQELHPTKLNFDNSDLLQNIQLYGSSTYPMRGLRGLKVSNEAPFTGTSPQINVSYTGLDRDALVELFNSLPDVSEATDGITRQINITAATGNNLTKVGTGVTIDENGIASGFSSSNYINFIQPFNPQNKIWEVGIKIQTGSNVNTEQYIFRSAISTPDTNGRFGIIFGISNKLINFNISKNGTSWRGGLTSTYIFNTNTIYFLIFGWNRNKYYVKVSTNGNNYTTIVDVNDTDSVFNGLTKTQLGIYSYGNSYANPFLGSIDLENTYIKVGQNYIMKGYLLDSDRAIATGKGWGITG